MNSVTKYFYQVDLSLVNYLSSLIIQLLFLDLMILVILIEMRLSLAA